MIDTLWTIWLHVWKPYIVISYLIFPIVYACLNYRELLRASSYTPFDDFCSMWLLAPVVVFSSLIGAIVVLVASFGWFIADRTAVLIGKITGEKRRK